MKIIKIKKTYLEMLQRPDMLNIGLKDGAVILKLETPQINYYRFLNKFVGGDLNWVDRQLMDDEKLLQIVHNELVEIYVLYYQGNPIGYSEIDRRKENEIELTYFGLIPEFRGKGFGKSFLNWTIDKVWSYNPKRLWLSTCEFDSPAAIPVYEKAGFNIVEERMEDQAVIMNNE